LYFEKIISDFSLPFEVFKLKSRNLESEPKESTFNSEHDDFEEFVKSKVVQID